MVCVPEEAVLDPCQFLDKVAQGYHIRLSPPTLSNDTQLFYLQEMIKKIKYDRQPLVATNINRYDNTVRDFVSVRRMRAGDMSMINVDIGEL